METELKQIRHVLLQPISRARARARAHLTSNAPLPNALSLSLSGMMIRRSAIVRRFSFCTGYASSSLCFFAPRRAACRYWDLEIVKVVCEH